MKDRPLKGGPDCPGCGCDLYWLRKTWAIDVEEMAKGGGSSSRTKQTWDRLRCTHCGKDTEVMAHEEKQAPGSDQPTVVRYCRVQCPACGYKRCPVQGTPSRPDDGPIQRQHKCGKCSHTFKSIEEKPPPKRSKKPKETGES